MKKASGLAQSPHVPKIALPNPLPNQSYRTLQDANKYHKYPFLPAQEPFPEPPKTSTWGPSGARYSRATYSWITQSLWFLDPTTLAGHPHILNVITLQYQYMQFWIVVNISAWRSYNQAAQSGWLQESRNVRIVQLWESDIRTHEDKSCGYKYPPSPSRKKRLNYPKTLVVQT